MSYLALPSSSVPANRTSICQFAQAPPHLLSRTASVISYVMKALHALCATGSEKSFDAVMSLASSRPGQLFTEKSLRNLLLSINPDIAPYPERNAHRRASR